MAKTTLRALLRKAAIDGHPAFDEAIRRLTDWAESYAHADHVLTRREARERLVLAAYDLVASGRTHLQERAREKALKRRTFAEMAERVGELPSGLLAAAAVDAKEGGR